MTLYLIQHAEAKSEQEDPSRGLSEKGLSDIKKIAHHAAVGLYIKVSQIFHSGKKRAQQTAQILAENLHPDSGIAESGGLAPMHEPKIWAERLSSIEEDIMLVGHLPHIGRLAALLICDDENKKAINFKMGGIVCLKRNEDMSWSLEWTLMPFQL